MLIQPLKKVHGGREAGRDCWVIEFVLSLGPIPSLRDPHLPEGLVSMRDGGRGAGRDCRVIVSVYLCPCTRSASAGRVGFDETEWYGSMTGIVGNCQMFISVRVAAAILWYAEYIVISCRFSGKIIIVGNSGFCRDMPFISVRVAAAIL